MILCLLSLQTIMGFNTQAVTHELNSENNTDQLVLNTPASYDLQGRRISSATPLKKGIYIFDGKKVVVK